MKKSTLILIIIGLAVAAAAISYNYSKNRAINQNVYQQEQTETIKQEVKKDLVESAEEIKEEIKETAENIKQDLKKPNEEPPAQVAPDCQQPPKFPPPENIPPTPPAPITPEIPKEQGQFLKEVENSIVNLVNGVRKENGVDELINNKLLEQFAEYKAQDMAARKYFSHEDPEGKYISDIMREKGVKFSGWGENIAYITTTKNISAQELAERFFNNWMESQGHKENILNSNFEEIGVGVYKIGDTYIATQQFLK